jgi:hypothetical protein
MPNIFNLLKDVLNIDIGTIAVYTCVKSCDTTAEGGAVEEYAFIQRTGEKMLDLEPEDKEVKKLEDEEFVNNFNKLKVKGNIDNTPDEDGWVEVKKKKK